MTNPVLWFEIPCMDIERAKNFYHNILKRNFQYIEMPGAKMYMFERMGDNGSNGALIQTKEDKPSKDGITVYFRSEDVAIEIARVAEAGGTVLSEKTSIGEFGFIAMFLDTEGNKVGLHSDN